MDKEGLRLPGATAELALDPLGFAEEEERCGEVKLLLLPDPLLLPKNVIVDADDPVEDTVGRAGGTERSEGGPSPSSATTDKDNLPVEGTERRALPVEPAFDA